MEALRGIMRGQQRHIVVDGDGRIRLATNTPEAYVRRDDWGSLIGVSAVDASLFVLIDAYE